MSDLLDEDLEFRGGTLQLSTEPVAAEDTATPATESRRTPSNVNPSVLSGADSLTSSSSSFAGKHPTLTLFGPLELLFGQFNVMYYCFYKHTGSFFFNVNLSHVGT